MKNSCPTVLGRLFYSKLENMYTKETVLISYFRLSRGRIVLENAFGILASRWPIFGKPIIASTDTIATTSICLQNYLMNNGDGRYFSSALVDREAGVGVGFTGEYRSEATNVLDINRTGSNMYRRMASETRATLAV